MVFIGTCMIQIIILILPKKKKSKIVHIIYMSNTLLQFDMKIEISILRIL